MEEIFVILALILLNGVFAMSEIVLISARKSSLKPEASKSARKALGLQDNPDRLLSSVQIGITLIGLLTGLFSGNKIANLLAPAAVSSPIRTSSKHSSAICTTTLRTPPTSWNVLVAEDGS